MPCALFPEYAGVIPALAEDAVREFDLLALPDVDAQHLPRIDGHGIVVGGRTDGETQVGLVDDLERAFGLADLDWLPENLFAFGTVMGGVYEYVFSAVTELLFGTVFWDYSKFKFNLGGRINLLYCFFWGIAAVLWMRYGYPLVLRLMKKVRSHIRPWMTAVLAVFMAVNMLTSALALARYDARTSGEAPNGQLEVFLDEHFDNARMERIYPNAKKVTKAE